MDAPVPAPHRSFGAQPLEEGVDLRRQLVGVVGDGAVHVGHRPAELVGQPPVRGEAQRRGVEVGSAVAQDHEAEVLLHEPAGRVERVEVPGDDRLAGGLRARARAPRADAAPTSGVSRAANTSPWRSSSSTALRTRSRSRSSSPRSHPTSSRLRVAIVSHGGPGCSGSSSSQSGALTPPPVGAGGPSAARRWRARPPRHRAPGLRWPRRAPATSRRMVARPNRRWNGDAAVRRLCTRSAGTSSRWCTRAPDATTSTSPSSALPARRWASAPHGTAEQRERREHEPGGEEEHDDGDGERDGERGAPDDGAAPGHRGAREQVAGPPALRSHAQHEHVAQGRRAGRGGSRSPSAAGLAGRAWRRCRARRSRSRALGGWGCRSRGRAAGGGAASCAGGGRAAPATRAGRRRMR